jgi:hypothetical protein
VSSIIHELLTKQDTKNMHILDKIDDFALFAKNILNSDDVIVWFEDKEEEKFWSYHKHHRISLDRNRFYEILENQFEEYIYRCEKQEFIDELQEFIKIGEITNTMFHSISCKNDNYHIVVQIVNLHDGIINFSRSIEDVVQILSLFISQTIKMQDISDLMKYYHEEQEKAFQKQKTVIKNEFQNSPIFKTKVFYEPSDILSGDSYSILKAGNGDVLVYIIDAMGHGIAPSLTAYSLSAIVQQRIKNSSDFGDLMQTLLDNSQYILTDEEQLTCGFFWFSNDLKTVDYVVAGMYAPLILDGDEVISAKANNIPFMNFAFDFTISRIDLNNFKRFMIFTDGLVEDTQDLNVELDRMLKDNEYQDEVMSRLDEMELEDDTTIVILEKR